MGNLKQIYGHKRKRLALEYILKIGIPFLLIAGLGWFAHRRVTSTCEVAVALSQNIPHAAAWMLAAKQDPFLAVKLDRDPIRASLRQFQKAAAIVRGDLGLLRLSGETKAQLSALAEARDQISRSVSILSFQPELLRTSCGTESGTQGKALAQQVQVAEEDWVEAQREAGKDKLAFAADREIYCQLSTLSDELETVVKTSTERCAARKPGAKACALEVNEALTKEMQDLEKKRQFNLLKLRRKWPDTILEQLKCVSFSA
jgi:hypothetical protein